MTPERLQAYVLVGMRDFLTPFVGLVLTTWLVMSGNFALWQCPFLAGLIGVPLVGRGSTRPASEEAPIPPEPVLTPGDGGDA